MICWSPPVTYITAFRLPLDQAVVSLALVAETLRCVKILVKAHM